MFGTMRFGFRGGPDLRGDLLVLAFHAAGWSGLLASRLAPDLRAVPHEHGVLHDAYAVLGLFDPVWNGLRRLQALLAALAATKERELRGGGAAGVAGDAPIAEEGNQ